jgi:hypothetical protein
VYLRNQKALWRKGATARSPWRCSRLYQQELPVCLHIIIHANYPGRINICQLNYYDVWRSGYEFHWRKILESSWVLCSYDYLVRNNHSIHAKYSHVLRTSPTKSWTPERRYASSFELLHNLVQIRQGIFLIYFFWRKTWDNPKIRDLHIIPLSMAMKPSEEAQKEPSSSSSSWDN